jgi:UDP:flavonoid glycosyltransferase YjiC (YdhE family)
VLTPFPPALRPGGRPYRAIEAAPGEGGGLVLVTLGTIFNTESGDLFERVLAGLEGDVVVATGDTRDPAGLGRQPPRVRLERRVDLGAILPRTSVVVCHAGSGTLLAALAHGVPLVCLPIGADQPGNARRAVELGTAIALDPLTATPAEIAAAVGAAPALRAVAEGVARAIAALPPPAAAVTLLTHPRHG